MKTKYTYGQSEWLKKNKHQKQNFPHFHCYITNEPCRNERRESIPWGIFCFHCEFKGIHTTSVF